MSVDEFKIWLAYFERERSLREVINLSQASISHWILACMSKTKMTMSELLIDFDAPHKTEEDKKREVDEKAKKSADILRIWMMKEYERQKANGEEKR